MPEIKILPILKNVLITFLFFLLGRLMVMQMGKVGVWIVAFLVIIFYAIWWVNYQRRKPK